MSLAISGSHKITVVAKDIHKHTDTLIFHKRSFDRRHKKDIVRSKDYLLPHHPGGTPHNAVKKPEQKRKIGEVVETEVEHQKHTLAPPPKKESWHQNNFRLRIQSSYV